MRKADVLGYSMGSFVAQQREVMHPEKVKGLYSLPHHVVEKRVYLSPQVVKFFSEVVNKSINNIPITLQDLKTLLSIPMGSAWMKLHPNFLESVSEAKDLFSAFLLIL